MTLRTLKYIGRSVNDVTFRDPINIGTSLRFTNALPKQAVSGRQIQKLRGEVIHNEPTKTPLDPECDQCTSFTDELSVRLKYSSAMSNKALLKQRIKDTCANALRAIDEDLLLDGFLPTDQAVFKLDIVHEGV